MGTRNAPDFSRLSLDPALVSEVDRTYGYRGVKLGTPLAQLAGLEFVARRGELVIYCRPADELQVGRARVSGIEYRFQNGQLREVALCFDSLLNGTRLRDAFSRVYGRGFGTGRVVCWWGEHAQILYRASQAGTGCLLISAAYAAPPAGKARLTMVSGGTE